MTTIHAKLLAACEAARKLPGLVEQQVVAEMRDEHRRAAKYGAQVDEIDKQIRDAIAEAKS